MAFPTTPIIETFTVGADAAPPNANWTRLAGFSFDIKALAATGKATSSAAAATGGDYWNAATFIPDQEAYLTISTLPASGDPSNLYLRLQGTPSSAVSGYRLTYTHGSPGTWQIFRSDAGTVTALTGSVSQSVATGQKIGFSAIGSLLTGYRFNGTSWSTVISYDISGDATKYTSGGFIGMALKNTQVRADDFGGGSANLEIVGKVQI